MKSGNLFLLFIALIFLGCGAKPIIYQTGTQVFNAAYNESEIKADGNRLIKNYDGRNDPQISAIAVHKDNTFSAVGLYKEREKGYVEVFLLTQLHRTFSNRDIGIMLGLEVDNPNIKNFVIKIEEMDFIDDELLLNLKITNLFGETTAMQYPISLKINIRTPSRFTKQVGASTGAPYPISVRRTALVLDRTDNRVKTVDGTIVENIPTAIRLHTNF
jgi:hypothetical protein